ncbi:MAG: hypothetical protein CVV47_07345 [Spirochaetae bacterium HGW-Spirochaetae-3]|jgi:uncharacterized protein (DUF58 family)|nr:MAG: hypothetical protein CVV47_07345 [Spirochaetae bacterium HGW-Spirochaetae-3]
MDEASLRERIRRLVFAAPALSEALGSGNFRSVFKGRGMDFEALREYDAGDDAMRMDWNATARFGKPYVKTYKDDRDLTLYLVIDESPSMEFGAGRTKRETAALAASLLAYACSLNGIRVGALFFGGAAAMDGRAPAAGQGAARALMERLAGGSARAAASAGETAGSDLGAALTAAASILKRRSLVLVVSDFMTSGYALPLALLARRNDVAALRVHDRLDSEPPGVGLSLRVADAESGASRLVVPRSAAYREARTRSAKTARLEWLVALSASKVPYLEMDSATDPVESLVAFFGRRRSA